MAGFLRREVCHGLVWCRFFAGKNTILLLPALPKYLDCEIIAQAEKKSQLQPLSNMSAKTYFGGGFVFILPSPANASSENFIKLDFLIRKGPPFRLPGWVGVKKPSLITRS